MIDALEQLKTILAEVADLERAAAVLNWDQETMMPPGGIETRASSMGTLARVAHDRFVAPEVGRLLAELEGRGYDPGSDEAALVRVTRRDYENEVRIPSELVVEAARASAEGLPAWAEARKLSDYSRFKSALDRNVDVNRRIADALGWTDRPFDALLQRYEPGMSTRQLEALFAELREAIVPLVHQIGERAGAVSDAPLHGDFDEAAQLEFARHVVTAFGYDWHRGRLDFSAHPFSIAFGNGDVRITTRVHRDFLSGCLYGTMHESGHAMYSQGHYPAHQGTPLWGGASPGFHESQSRMWENLIGRSRPFWEHFLPEARRRFPALAGVDHEAMYRAVNKVQPSLIRVEADEVTYNLHIMLRFELENMLLEGELPVDEVPEAWNERIERYLGIQVPNDAEGALQDIHWSGIAFGIFPGYTLGNVIGAQLMETIRVDIDDLDHRIAAGDFRSLHEWLHRKVWIEGRKHTPGELLHRITDRDLTPGPWIDYVRRKFGELYEL